MATPPDGRLPVPRIAVSEFPMPDSPQIAGGGAKKRNKVMLMPGHSQMDWMRRVKSGENLAGRRAGEGVRKISPKEVALHCTEADAWTILRGVVFNLTPYLSYHPGGVDELMRVAGRDGTDLFNEIHAWVNLEAMLGSSAIGVAADVPFDPPPSQPPDLEAGGASSAAAPPVAAGPTFRQWMLTLTSPVNHDTSILTLIPVARGPAAAFPLAAHVEVRAKIGGAVVARPYTPITVDAGAVALLIKRYATGPMSSHLHALRPGAIVELSEPLASSMPSLDAYARVVMIAAGTGITPMWRLLAGMLADPRDTTVFDLLFANRTKADILMRRELDAMAAAAPGRVRVTYILSQPSEGWKGRSGHVDAALLSELLFPRGAEDSSIALVCGPAGFSHAVESALTALGQSARHVFRAGDGVPVGGASSSAGSPGAAAAASAEAAAPQSKRRWTRAEVYAHNSPTDLWLVIAGKVYDVSRFVPQHPGRDAILRGGGHDATEDFAAAFHSPKATAMLKEFYIGRVTD